MTKFLNISTDNTLGGNSPSNELVASQKAIKEYVDNKSVDIDNSTITKNSSDELQAVATINANTAVGATNPVYDWVGTLAEYTAQDIENQHPDWICYITDDVSGGASVYTKTEVDNNFVGKGHEVIEFQAPTAQNNYTWYRKYADGWVEQGGIQNGSVNIAPGTEANLGTITLPIQMANSSYCALATGDGYTTLMNMNLTRSSCIFIFGAYGSATRTLTYVCWEVKGMAA